jgi:hypothetical protein
MRPISPLRFIFLHRPGISFLLACLVAVAVAVGLTSRVLEQQWTKKLKKISMMNFPDLILTNFKDTDIQDHIAQFDFIERTLVRKIMVPNSRLEQRPTSTCFIIHAIDPNTDFSVKEWLEDGSSVINLGPNDIWVGNRDIQLGDTVRIGSEKFLVTGNIDETRGPMLWRDSCFINQQSLLSEMPKGLLVEQSRKGSELFSEFKFSKIDIKLKPVTQGGVPIEEAARRLEKSFKNEVVDSVWPSKEWLAHFLAALDFLRSFSIMLWPVAMFCFFIGSIRLMLLMRDEVSSKTLFLSSVAKAAIISLTGAAAGFGITISFWLALLGRSLTELCVDQRDFFCKLSPPSMTDFIYSSALIIPLALSLAVAGALIATWRALKAAVEPGEQAGGD